MQGMSNKKIKFPGAFAFAVNDLGECPGKIPHHNSSRNIPEL